jgi:hypothetical protein
MTITETRPADWHDIPRGFYAVPVTDDEEPYLLGYMLYERTEPRTFKNGRTVGKHQWREGRTPIEGHTYLHRSYILEPGITFRPRFAEHYFSDFWRRADIEFVLEFTESCRATFGQLVGRCGCCGRTLTDPQSKLRGIGPECIKGFRGSSPSVTA